MGGLMLPVGPTVMEALCPVVVLLWPSGHVVVHCDAAGMSGARGCGKGEGQKHGGLRAATSARVWGV